MSFDFSRFDYFFDYDSFSSLCKEKEYFKAKFKRLDGQRVYRSGECVAFGLMVGCKPEWCRSQPKAKMTAEGTFSYPVLYGITKEQAEYVRSLPFGFLKSGRTYFMRGRFFIDVTDDG